MKSSRRSLFKLLAGATAAAAMEVCGLLPVRKAPEVAHSFTIWMKVVGGYSSKTLHMALPVGEQPSDYSEEEIEAKVAEYERDKDLYEGNGFIYTKAWREVPVDPNVAFKPICLPNTLQNS